MNRANSRAGAQLEAGHIGQIVALDDGRDAIGVARDDMTAKFVADFQRALEVELRAVAQCFAVVMPSVSAAASTSTRFFRPRTPRPPR